MSVTVSQMQQYEFFSIPSQEYEMLQRVRQPVVCAGLCRDAEISVHDGGISLANDNGHARTHRSGTEYNISSVEVEESVSKKYSQMLMAITFFFCI